VLESDRPVWDAFNVGSGKSVTVREIATMLPRLLGKNIAPEILGRSRVGDIRHCFADISKIERVFGITPKRDFESGMAELIEWVRTADKPVDRSAESMAALEKGKLLV
jgi:dTDP-L-rhamnose 4-epimerase